MNFFEINLKFLFFKKYIKAFLFFVLIKRGLKMAQVNNAQQTANAKPVASASGNGSAAEMAPKPWYKKWWVWVIAVVIVAGLVYYFI